MKAITLCAVACEWRTSQRGTQEQGRLNTAISVCVKCIQISRKLGVPTIGANFDLCIRSLMETLKISSLKMTFKISEPVWKLV